MFNKQYHTYIY